LYKTMLPIIAMPSKSRGGTCLGEVRRAWLKNRRLSKSH
jgi:hypothetical protein